MKPRLVISRTPKKCADCKKNIKIGEECVRTGYRIFLHKKCIAPIKVRVKCPYKNEEDYEKDYLETLSKEKIEILFKQFVKGVGYWYVLYIKSKIKELRNLSVTIRKKEFGDATMEEIILDMMKYILIQNYKDLGWNVQLHK